MRTFLRLLSPLLATTVVLTGALLLLEVGWAMARPERGPVLVPWPDLLRDGAELAWHDRLTITSAGVLLGAGVVLLLVALLTGRHDVTMRSPAPDVAVTTSPRSLARIIGQRVRGTDGVRSASVTASARAVRVRATSRLLDESRLRPVLIEAVSDLVDELPLAHAPKVHVVVHSPKDRP